MQASVGFIGGHRTDIVSLHYKRWDHSGWVKSSSFLLKQNCLDMPEVYPRGLKSFWGVRRWSVSWKFRTRYCGHTLSRLADTRHNRTKQNGFPTIRRKELKSQASLNTIQRVLGLVGTCRLLFWGWQHASRVRAMKGWDLNHWWMVWSFRFATRKQHLCGWLVWLGLLLGNVALSFKRVKAEQGYCSP
jgi:hypothetical protein